MKSFIKRILYFFKAKKIVTIYQPIDKEKILDGKVAIITGGSGGIGFAIAKKFVESGCKVILVGTNSEKLESLCKKLGDSAKFLEMNLYDVKSFKSKIEQAVNLFGKIDICVNSAGKHISKVNLDFLTTTVSEYEEIMDLNLKSTYFFIQEIAKYMISSKIKGHILIISSQSALEPAWSPYRLSKWGIKGITSGIAQKLLPYGIIVNAIGPGPTATSMQDYREGDNIYTTGNTIERYTMPDDKGKAILSDIATEEMAHLEIISAMVYQLLDGATPEELKKAGLGSQYTEHKNAVFPQNANGIPFTAAYFAVTGDPLTDLAEDMAAEQKARTVYENLMDLTDDEDILAPLSFLREREVVHYERFKALYEEYAKKRLGDKSYLI